MKAKKIIALVVAIACVLSMISLAGCGEKETNDANKAKYTVGICQLVQHEALDAATKGFKDALKKEFGDEIEFIEQNAQGEATACATIVNDFVTKNVDLMLANATPALQAAADATSTIPVLGTSITEYSVALGLKDFNGTVGTNVSGTSDLAPLDEQAAMITELYPEAKNVGLLFCSAEANSRYQVDFVKEELSKKGITCTEFPFSDSNDVASVASACAAASDVIYIPTDNTAASCAATINGAIDKTPVIAGEEGICAQCGVATLSISYYDLGKKTGEMAAKILKGEAKVEEMAIEYAPATKKYNAIKCEELQFTVPSDYVKIEEK